MNISKNNVFSPVCYIILTSAVTLKPLTFGYYSKCLTPEGHWWTSKSSCFIHHHLKCMSKKSRTVELQWLVWAGRESYNFISVYFFISFKECLILCVWQYMQFISNIVGICNILNTYFSHALLNMQYICVWPVCNIFMYGMYTSI